MKIRRKKTKYFINKKSQSIYDYTGKIVWFSYGDFIEQIVKGNHCFICGAEPDSKPFSSEHIIPKWILKHYGDDDSFMILPNKTEIKNNKYLVPCCSDCNAELGSILESPIKTLLRKSYKEVIEELEKDENLYGKIYHWVALIFFKTHLKDKYLLKERDKRNQSGVISEDYCWHCLHHIHNVIRQHYTGTRISNGAYGTILVLESLREQELETFDYMDNLDSQIAMVQLGSIVIFVALTDCQVSQGLYRTFFSKLGGSLTSVQIREVFVRLRYVIENVKNKPRFITSFKGKNPKIIAKIEDKFAMYQGSEERKSLFELMRFYIGDIMPSTLPNREKLLEDLEKGKSQYIFDENYNFFQHKPYGPEN